MDFALFWQKKCHALLILFSKSVFPCVAKQHEQFSRNSLDFMDA